MHLGHAPKDFVKPGGRSSHRYRSNYSEMMRFIDSAIRTTKKKMHARE